MLCGYEIEHTGICFVGARKGRQGSNCERYDSQRSITPSRENVGACKIIGMITDILIVGSGVAGLYCALNLPENKNITIVTKNEAQKSDSFLAQGGICVLRDEEDYKVFFEDTMKAGHYENNPDSVEIMIRSSQEVIGELVSFGVRFEKDGEAFTYTREGAHSRPRILFHEDETGKEITSHLLETARSRKNITLIENFTMVDLLCSDNVCNGIVGHDAKGDYISISADYTVLATGGIGGLFKNSTNYRHLTGDALALAIFDEMKKDGSEHVWLSMAPISEAEIKNHFPNIYQHCLDEGYNVTKEPIPVVPSQHYFMGGIDVDCYSKTSMGHLYAVGETACNGVHGRNRLASNSLLESLVFAKRAAKHIADNYCEAEQLTDIMVDASQYEGYADKYKELVLAAIEKEKLSHE